MTDLQRDGVPTLGNGRCVLIDYFGRHWPASGDEVVEYLQAGGYQPILAHPERMDFPDDEWNAVIERLESAGVWLQGNLRCLAGCEGSLALARGLALLEQHRYPLARHPICMACTISISDCWASTPLVLSVDEAEFEKLLHQHPAEILGLD